MELEKSQEDWGWGGMAAFSGSVLLKKKKMSFEFVTLISFLKKLKREWLRFSMMTHPRLDQAIKRRDVLQSKNLRTQQKEFSEEIITPDT